MKNEYIRLATAITIALSIFGVVMVWHRHVLAILGMTAVVMSVVILIAFAVWGIFTLLTPKK